MIQVRERPPTRLAIDIETPGGRHARWALDERDPANVPAGLTFSTTMPGGFDQLSCTLARREDRDYPDLREFSTLTAYGAGGETAWQGRLETTPRTSGDQLAITPGAVGWQAALDDDAAARMIYVDCDLTRWQPASVQRKLNMASISSTDVDDPQTATDYSTGFPSVVTGFQGPWGRAHRAEAWYDAKEIPIETLFYAWRRSDLVDPADTNWDWRAYLADDDIASAFDASASLRAAGPGSGSLSATTQTRMFALVPLAYAAAGGTSDNYTLYWQLAVVGNHGLTLHTPAFTDFAGEPGVLASDVVMHAVSTWAPALATSSAGLSTIAPTSFVIPQLSFVDPTTASQIITQALQFETLDWWVDEGPTFNLAARANHGRDWQARVGPSGLQETGPQVDRMYNAVIVSYNDVSGVARTVGPPGETVNSTDASLADTDPANPVNAAGLERLYEYPNIGVSTAAGAIAVGQRFLAEMKQASTAGQASIVGHVQDAQGNWAPAWAIRAGDRIAFVDAHDTSSRRVTKAAYDDGSKTCQIDLDSPPEGLPALLARYQIALAPLGLR
jgi:hypothetical protein